VIKQILAMTGLALASHVVLVEPAHCDEEVNLGRVMWSAFECATYADLSGDEDEQKRLFKVGYEAGTNFVDGVKNGEISDSEAKQAPTGVLMLLNGPTTDFVIGRIYESASGNAFDKVVKRDSDGGLILDPTEWATGEYRTLRAKNLFQSSNCTLVR
jgi:hypothetical protein